MSTGFVLWFTGLSGSGKSTLAAIVSAELRRRGIHVETLDGDEIRKHLSKGLGFSREDRDTNIRRLGFVAKLVARSGGCAITAAISPYRQVRDEIRHDIERFCEVHCDCPISVLAERDPKGLYKKALRGEIKNFTGIDDPYEPPPSPEVHIHSDREPPEESARRIVERLEALGFVSAETSAIAAVEATASLPPPHGGELSDRWLAGRDADEERAAARSLPSIALSPEGELATAGFALGTLSPLRGFMGSKDYLRVTRERRLEGGLVWPVPVVLPLTDDVVRSLQAGARAALRGTDGALLGTMEVSELWSPDAGANAVYAAGDVRVFELPAAASGCAASGPRELRARLRERGMAHVAALQSGRAPHLTEEHAARSALELFDGLLFQLRSSADGVPSLPTRRLCYERLIETCLPAARTLLASYPAVAPSAAGSSLLLDAIVAKNYGASALIVCEEELERDSAREARARDARLLTELGVRVIPAAQAFHARTLGTLISTRTTPAGAPSFDAREAMRSEIEALLGRV